MRLNIAIFCLWAAFPLTSHSQGDLEKALATIEANNPSLEASRKKWEAANLQYQTGRSLPNPVLEYDYMIGRPAAAGNQTDFLLTQSFDFPTVYARRNEYLDSRQLEAEREWLRERQELLLKARLECIQVIHLNRRRSEIESRLSRAAQMLRAWEAKLERGDATRMDLNKARLLVLARTHDLQMIDLEIANSLTALSLFNGGSPLELRDTLYPERPVLPGFAPLEAEIEAGDPVLRTLEQARKSAELGIGLSRAESMPKFTLGYHYQAILGQTFNGVHLAVSLPFWENRNQVSYRQAEFIASDQLITSHRNDHFHEITTLYQTVSRMQEGLEQYETALQGATDLSLLEKALQLGELTFIQFSLELEFYYDALDRYQEMELHYQKALAELYKYKL